VGVGVWGVGFYPFSGGQLPNFQGKSPWIFPPITPRVGTFWGKKSLKTLLDKVFRFIQQTLDRWFPSSKRCSNCGYIAEKMPLNIRQWDCPDCGTHHDRDINASKNILAAGLAVSVCRATIRPEQSKSVKAGAEPRKGKKQKPKSWGLGITVSLERGVSNDRDEAVVQ
jgi:hypothetical protein